MSVRLLFGRPVMAWGLALLALAGAAQAAVIERVTVLSTTVAEVPEDLVLANMESQPGRTFSPQILSEDIKRLFLTNAFADVVTEVAELPDDKILVTVRVTPKPTVRGILIAGNQQVSTRRLRNLVEQLEGAPLDEAQVAADTNAIRKFYRDRGRLHAEVQSYVQPIPNTGDVNVEFRVAEERRAKLQGVEFTGNTAFTERELRKQLTTRRHWLRRIFRVGYFDPEKLRLDQDALRRSYTSRGYLDFRVTRIEEVYNAKETWVTLVYHLDEGAPYTISAVTIAGNTLFGTDELLALTRLAPGNVYDSDVENADMERIRAKYDVLGHIDFRVFPAQLADRAAQSVAIEYRLSEGIPAHIRDIHIEGNEITRDDVIRRELALHPGDLGDASKIRTSRSRLAGLNYFERVDITPMATEREDLKDLAIELEEKRTGQLMLGAGFSSADSVVGFVEVTQANFDWRNYPTFRGGGQRLRLRAQLGTERTDLLLAFTEPWWLQRRLRLDLDALMNSRSEDEYTQETLGVGAVVTRPLGGFWNQSFGLRLQQIELNDFSAGLSPELLAEEGNYNASRFIFRLRRDSRDRHINPSKGAVFAFGSELITKVLGGYSDVYRVTVQGSKYFPVFRDSVLKLDAEIGVADKISGDNVAIFDRYFAGGEYSVRGFRRRSISPVDANEDPLGGRSMLVGTIELITPLTERVRGSVFCDMGNVWRKVGEINPAEMNISVGVGIQLELPIGPIRLDYGWPVVRELDHLGSGGRLHFNLGYYF